METQILLAGDLDLIEKGELGTLKKDIAEIERMLKALIKSLENKPLNPWPLESLDPLLQLIWRRTLIIYSGRPRKTRSILCFDLLYEVTSNVKEVIIKILVLIGKKVGKIMVTMEKIKKDRDKKITEAKNGKKWIS